MVTVVYFQGLSEARQFISESRYLSPKSANTDRAPSLSGCTTLRMIRNWWVVDLFVCSEKLCLKIPEMNWFRICEKNKIPWWLQKNVYVVDQSKIVANKHKNVYPTIKWIITILITHRIYIDCITLIHNKQSHSCHSYCYHVTD